MIDWIIQTIERGGYVPVTAIIQAPNASYSKLIVNTYNINDPALPSTVYSAIQNAGLNCECVLVMRVNGSGVGATTLYITTSESKMLSEDPSGIPDGVVAVFDQLNALCLAVVPSKGKIKEEFV